MACVARDLRAGSPARRPGKNTAILPSASGIARSYERNRNDVRRCETGSSSVKQVTKYVPKSDSFPRCTHIAFRGKTEIVTVGDRLFYRTDSRSPFRESAIKGLRGTHSVVVNPHDRLRYARDQGNHWLNAFRDPESYQGKIRLASVADVTVKRPHDIVLDRSSD